MSTLSSSHPAWWPKSDKSSHSKQPTKFNLASAIGLKPKKPQPPPLTITDAPRIPASVVPIPAPSPTARRPASGSVSSAKSIEPKTPKTPEDALHPRRGSLLTLSDPDPFAARAVAVHSPSDPNRLLAFSNSSLLAHETKSPEGMNRVSYASSSSHSFRLGSDLSPMSIGSPISDAGSSYIKPKRSRHNLRGKETSVDSTTWLSNLGIDYNRFSQPDPPPKPRPAMRARGMTDAGIERRQLSLSRPTAPPNSELPPPPSLGHNSAGSTSSTSLTFSTEFASSPRTRTIDLGETQSSSRSTHRTLKKSVSHQSIKRGQPSPPVAPPPPETKPPRKQRSFHRLPVQAVPLHLPIAEQRAEPSLSARKRLFSTSSGRRPSTATIDTRSLNGSTAAEPSATSSYWIDTDQPPRSPTSTHHEYTPQQIIDFGTDYGHGLSPSPPFGSGRSRSNSDHPSVRKSSVSDHDLYYPMATPPPPMMTSLPPPPRRTRPRAPPPLSRSHSDVVTPLPPPPRKNLRPKVSADKRQSLMRKPSFLDIDDDVDREPAPAPSMLRQGSFLDLTRGSFESERSEDDGF
ncbi:hypothetical protein FB45DRAFT_917689 [Roridomyces roridus]|uniref:Uncharacterized protein n=1 Tax=Roridomyces roridus TaxID=1738132 RepID=A0AAD7BUX4_9AGAR|nr:hypothetical protein FB45DRAFT_917689 [Roridomyces roridus]